MQWFVYRYVRKSSIYWQIRVFMSRWSLLFWLWVFTAVSAGSGKLWGSQPLVWEWIFHHTVTVTVMVNSSLFHWTTSLLHQQTVHQLSNNMILFGLFWTNWCKFVKLVRKYPPWHIQYVCNDRWHLNNRDSVMSDEWKRVLRQLNFPSCTLMPTDRRHCRPKRDKNQDGLALLNDFWQRGDTCREDLRLASMISRKHLRYL